MNDMVTGIGNWAFITRKAAGIGRCWELFHFQTNFFGQRGDGFMHFVVS
jgi:hypothetical protein